MGVPCSYSEFQIIKQVPGVEADDVIGTLAIKSVASGYKVLFQLSLLLLKLLDLICLVERRLFYLLLAPFMVAFLTSF